MYEKILLPTDGSPPSVAAALHAISLAGKIGAEILALQVIPPYQYPIYLEYAPANLFSEEEYLAQCQEGADHHLAMIAAQAKAANVKCTGTVLFHGNAAQSIVDYATSESCELIVMGSHGRSGLSRLFLGSVTAKVLALSHLPVLVHRATEAELAVAEQLIGTNARAPRSGSGAASDHVA